MSVTQYCVCLCVCVRDTFTHPEQFLLPAVTQDNDEITHRSILASESLIFMRLFFRSSHSQVKNVFGSLEASGTKPGESQTASGFE